MKHLEPPYGMSLRAALQWAANERGVLVESKLEKIAQARGYSRGWVYHNAWIPWPEALKNAQRWSQQKRRKG
jgi:hypothetical protein